MAEAHRREVPLEQELAAMQGAAMHEESGGRFGRSIQAEQCDIDRRRIAKLEHRRRVRPNPVGHVRIHEADRTVGGSIVTAIGMRASAARQRRCWVPSRAATADARRETRTDSRCHCADIHSRYALAFPAAPAMEFESRR